ncbi:glycosyltransferase family 2 protein [Clostridium perfringens]|uniref:glycosyltransferase family 2 protein n=1 Tax=Clostridium perfringens TaxID=1502 RepID=UPI0022E92BD1|nr:glycosyltransferase family 2 protein [Clostridium perfringens]
MGIEAKINYQLNKYPLIKKVIKRVYQRTMYTLSPKIKSEGNIERVSPNDPNYEYFFGYYDKSPWDATDRYMLCMKANDTWNDVSPKETAQIIIIDTERKNKVTVLAETHSWNVQQSCMLQWLGPDYSNRVIYNDYRDGRYCSIILYLNFNKEEIEVQEEKVIPAPVYSVAADGTFALTLDFSRLYRLRPGYGYYNVPETTANEKLPDKTCIWKVDLVSGDVKSVLKYTDFANFEPRFEMCEAEHKVNHIMISPNGKRFMVLYRWFNGQRKYTRLVTCNIDGTDMYNLSDDDMVSHCCWKNDNEILAFENKKNSGNGYYLMRDKSKEYEHYWKGIDYDGHPSYSPDGSKVVFDSYPDRARIASVMLSDSDNRISEKVNTVARVFAPFKYDNDTRCDLHPRWNRKGNKICFDSVFEGHRGLYIIKLQQEEYDRIYYRKEYFDDKKKSEDIKFSIITPVFNSFSLMERYFESLNNQSYKNFEIILVDDGSSDGSYEKLLEYQKTSNLIIKILKTEKNSGPGYARNIGIEAASGEWITFIDNDDWVSIELLSKVYRIIKREEADCVIYDYFIEREGKEKIVAKSVIGESGGNISVAKCVMSVTNHAVGKFYKRSNCVKNEVYFPHTRRCEDVTFTTLAVSVCKNIYYLEEPMYYYFQRGASLSNNSNLGEKDMVDAFRILQERIEDKYPYEIKEKSIRDLLYGGVLLMCKAEKNNKEIKDYIKNYEKKYPGWFNCNMVNKVGKAKYIFLQCIRFKQIGILKFLSKVHTKLIKG